MASDPGESVASVHDIRAVTAPLAAADMVRHLITERFAGQTVVTASLRAPAIVTLKMIADADPATPVIFCHPKPVFAESEKYRREIVDLLKLTNVTVVTKSDPRGEPRPFELCERLVNGRTVEILHLNQTLAPYRCWVRAVYHEYLPSRDRRRVQVYGGMVIVDALRRRTPEAIDRYMRDHGLPFHPKISKRKRTRTSEPPAQEIGYHF